MGKKTKFGDARDSGWISVFIRVGDGSLDSLAISAIKEFLVITWYTMKSERRSIRQLALELNEPVDRIRRLVHKIPGLADELGYRMQTNERLTR